MTDYKNYRVWFRNPRSADRQLQCEVVRASSEKAAREIYEDLDYADISVDEKVALASGRVALVDGETTLVTGREACPTVCPLTAAQIARDADDADTLATRASDYPM